MGNNNSKVINFNTHQSIISLTITIAVPQEHGTVGIQSVHCGNYLRMDGENVTDNGGGVVNCQSFVGYMEKFNIRMFSFTNLSLYILTSSFSTLMHRTTQYNILKLPQKIIVCKEQLFFSSGPLVERWG